MSDPTRARHPLVAASLAAVLTLAGCAATSRAQPADPKPAPTPPVNPAPPASPPVADTSARLTDRSNLDETLAALQAVGKDLREFSANVTLTDTNPATGAETSRTGRVLYQRRDDDPRLRVTLDRHKVGRAVREDLIDYVLDKGILIERQARQKLQVIRRVLKPGQKINLLKLGEGPFPLPIGQDPAAVKAEFDVKKLDPADGDPKDTLHLQLVPKKAGQFARKFKSIDVWVSHATRLPARIDTLDADDRVRSTLLESFRVNPDPPLTNADFTLPDLPKDAGWNTVDEATTEP